MTFGMSMYRNSSDLFKAMKEEIELLQNGVVAERNRCISIAQSIDPYNEAEAHLIETIVRKMRGDE